jgi:hypothetical protein
VKNFNGEICNKGGLFAQIHDHTVRFFTKLQPTERVSAKIANVDKPFNGRWYERVRFGGSVSRIPAIYRFLKAWSKFFSKHEAKAATAPAKLIEIDTAFVDETDVKPSAHEAKCVTIDQKARIVTSVNLNAYKRAALRFFPRVFMAHDSFAIAANGVVAKYNRLLGKLKRNVRVSTADSAIIESQLNKVKNGVIAPAIKAEAECIQSNRVIQHGKTATAEVAEADCVQYIRVVTNDMTANAEAAGGSDMGVNRSVADSCSATPCVWFFPEYTDGTLQIFQSVSGVQSGNTVEIDTESESVYWANAFVRDGVANLVFAQTEPQTSGELELI